MQPPGHSTHWKRCQVTPAEFVQSGTWDKRQIACQQMVLLMVQKPGGHRLMLVVHLIRLFYIPMWSAGFLPSTLKGRMHSFHCFCALHRVPPVWHCHDTEGIGEESSETLRLDFNNLVTICGWKKKHTLHHLKFSKVRWSHDFWWSFETSIYTLFN